MKKDNLEFLGEISAGLIHEVNNPVTSVLSRLEVLKLKIKRGNLSNEIINQEIVTMTEKMQQISRIIGTIQDLSRDRVRTEFVVFDISELIEKLCDELRERMSRSQIELDWNASENVLFYADLSEVLQVTENVIRNAVDAIGKNGKIKLSSKIVDGKAVLDISNSGEKLDSKLASKLFVPFYTTKKSSGTGLGLCISKRIMQRNQGDLIFLEDADSTTFRLILNEADIND